jgi:hypothetical protein
MKTLIFAAVAGLAFTFAGGSDAEAGGFHGYGHGGFYGGHIHHDVNPWIHPGHGHLHWHDTTHYDFIPGRWVQHGCHSHWIPGRWVLHQDGHFDVHH